MKGDGKVYIEAAKLVHADWKSKRSPGADNYSCCAISDTTGLLWCPQRQTYRSMFAPGYPLDDPDWVGLNYGSASAGRRMSVEETKQFRVLALCLMAAIAEAGDA